MFIRISVLIIITMIGEGRLNSLSVDVIMDLSPGDEISTLFVKYLGDDAIATGTRFRQKFSSFR